MANEEPDRDFDAEALFTEDAPKDLDADVTAFEAELAKVLKDKAVAEALGKLAEGEASISKATGPMIAIGIRDPVGWSQGGTHFLFNWNPRNPANVTAQLCTQATMRGAIRRADYGLHRRVSRCSGPGRPLYYYRLTCKRLPDVND